MEAMLNQIVDPTRVAQYFIDKQLLQKYTRKVDKVPLNCWKNVRQMYLIGAEAALKSGVEPGIYLDATCQWMLIIGASSEDIQEYFTCCAASLEVLNVFGMDIPGLDVGNLTVLKEFVLKANTALTGLQGLGRLKQLEAMTLWNSQVSSIKFLTALPELRTLDLSYNDCLRDIYGLELLQNLEYLDVGFLPLKQLHLEGMLNKLTYLASSFTPLEDAGFLSMIPNIETLWLQGICLSNIPSLENLSHLDTLVLSDSSLSTLDGVVFPDSLDYLDLAYTKICNLPDSVGMLRGLHSLNLSGLQLQELPDWLPELGLSVGRNSACGIKLMDATIDGVDMCIFDQPQEMIRAWFEERKSGKAQPLNELKVVFLGDGGVGKSRTIARLLLDGGQTEDFPNVSTPGIVIQDKNYEIGNRNVKVHFWDFGGQDILHSMHRMFLTERTLYVVMLNVRDGTQTERGRYWLHNIRSFAGDAPVLLVLNQIDTNHNASVNMPDLRAMYPSLTEDVKMSALEDKPEVIQGNLIAALKRQIGAFPTLESPFLPAWNRLKERLHGMEDYYIKGDEFERYCAECGVEDSEKTRLALLRWFSDLGVSFHYGPSAKLKDVVILRPDWITNAIYTIIFNKSKDTDNGLTSHDAIYELLSSKSSEIRRAIPKMVYQKHEVDYVLDVIRKFRLSFRVGDDMEFIPMLCRADSLPIAAAYEKDPNTLEFRMEYEYLPGNVLHRLMVELRRDLDTSQVWLTGALFKQASNGLSAVVKTEGNVLRIFVKGESDLHRPHTYLNTIRDALTAIQQDMGLTEPESFIVYKKNGQPECFAYEDLLVYLENGMQMVCSRKTRKLIRILDILDQSDREVERKKQKLLADVAGACVRMQNNRVLWKASEDDRNTDLRNALLNMRYRVADQSLAGVGAGGKNAGELDLLIMNEQNLPWMVCEAMNIKNDTPSQIEYWNRHLNKLLVNYNSAGMQDLLLVSYVSADPEEFKLYWQTYNEHMRWYDPPEVIRREGTYQVISPLPEQYNCLWAARGTYDRGGMPTTVYHYFLRLGL